MSFTRSRLKSRLITPRGRGKTSAPRITIHDSLFVRKCEYRMAAYSKKKKPNPLPLISNLRIKPLNKYNLGMRYGSRGKGKRKKGVRKYWLGFGAGRTENRRRRRTTMVMTNYTDNRLRNYIISFSFLFF